MLHKRKRRDARDFWAYWLYSHWENQFFLAGEYDWAETPPEKHAKFAKFGEM